MEIDSKITYNEKMKILFYSTNSNEFNADTFKITTYPSTNQIFEEFTKKYADDEFYVVTQEPCFFMPNAKDKNSSNIFILPPESSYKDMATKIIDISPDIAIAMTFWVDPFDWLTVNDSLVAEILEENNIKTISHSIETGLTCFDKTKTNTKLKELGFKVPKAVFVDHDLYFCAGSNKKVIHNVYKTAIASQIKKLHTPLIIKDTVGVSSYGTTVVHTHNEAIGYLNSKRNNSNRIVEEYISGQQMGTEIYGIKGNYTIMPPIKFSLNQYGITSPKLSAKYGPVTEEDGYNLKDLNQKLTTLAENMDFQGIAQVDLIYKDNQWYIIEINPRLSGMTYTYSYSFPNGGKSIFEIMYESSIQKKSLPVNIKKVLNIKLPIIGEELCKKLENIPQIKFIHKTNDLNAKQEREKGYTEIIIIGDSYEDICNTVLNIKEYISEEDFKNIDCFLNLQK